MLPRKPLSHEQRKISEASARQLRGVSSADRMKATADLMEEIRLGEKAKNQRTLAVAAEKIEKKLPKTAEALGHLGAGKSYGDQ